MKYTTIALSIAGVLIAATAVAIGTAGSPPRSKRPCSAFLVGNTGKGAGTVTDKCSKLVWQKMQEDTLLSAPDAVAYCTNLILAGKTDWRLPTENELATIIDYSAGDPAISPLLTFEQVTPPGGFVFSWSSTPSVYVANRTWGVRWSDALATSFNNAETLGARCVRS